MSQPSMTNSMMKGLFSLEGRMRRGDFWVTTISLSMAATVLSLALNSTFRSFGAPTRIGVIFLITQLIIAWPAYAISVKRGHDRNYSGWRTFWLNVLSHGVPIALIVVPLFMNMRPQWGGAIWVFLVLTAYMAVDYGMLDGAPGENRFGPSPKGPIVV